MGHGSKRGRKKAILIKRRMSAPSTARDRVRGGSRSLGIVCAVLLLPLAARAASAAGRVSRSTSRKKGFVSALAGSAVASAAASATASSSSTQGSCCQVCPENFYGELSFLDVPLATRGKPVEIPQSALSVYVLNTISASFLQNEQAATNNGGRKNQSRERQLYSRLLGLRIDSIW